MGSVSEEGRMEMESEKWVNSEGEESKEGGQSEETGGERVWRREALP